MDKCQTLRYDAYTIVNAAYDDAYTRGLEQFAQGMQVASIVARNCKFNAILSKCE